MSPAAPQGPTQGGCSHLAAWGPWESPPQHTACTGSGVGAIAPGRVPGSPSPANPQSSFSNWPWWGARRAARQPAGVGRARHGVPAVTTLSPRRAMAQQHPAPPPQSQARPAPALHNACCVRGAWAAAPGARHRQPHGPPRAALGLLRSPGMPRGTLHQVPAIPAGCWAQLGAGSRSRSPAAGSAVPTTQRPCGSTAGCQRAPRAPRSQKPDDLQNKKNHNSASFLLAVLGKSRAQHDTAETCGTTGHRSWQPGKAAKCRLPGHEADPAPRNCCPVPTHPQLGGSEPP